MDRLGDWMQTYTGAQFWPLDPRADEIRIDDIASALSKQCRYAGHCIKFYSVAEHCVHVANAAPDNLKLTALLHDASEAYLSDIVRPLKAHLANYTQIEAGLEKVIAEKFGLQWPMPKEIKALDNGILIDEMTQNMAPAPRPWEKWLTDPALGVTLQFWTSSEARYQFICAFHRYGGERG